MSDLILGNLLYSYPYYRATSYRSTLQQPVKTPCCPITAQIS